MASVGPAFPGTMGNDATVGAAAWSGTGNVAADDGTSASVSLDNLGSNSSQYLKCTNFGFAIDGGATIVGIVDEVKRRKASGSANVVDLSCKVVKADGSFGSSEEGDTGTNWPTSLTIKTYGGAANLRGETWTPSDLNDPDSGIAIAANRAGLGPSAVAEIDFVRRTIYYTTGGSGRVHRVTSMNGLGGAGQSTLNPSLEL